MDFSHIPGGRPVSDASNLDRFHLYTTFQKDETKVFNCRLFKHAFLLEVETVLLEDVKDLYHNCMVSFFGLATKKKYVIHVDGHNSLIYEILEEDLGK